MYWLKKKKNIRRKIRLYLDPDLIDFLRFRESRETGIYCDTGVNKQHNNPVPENSYFCPGDIFSSKSKCRILRNMPDTTSASAHPLPADFHRAEEEEGYWCCLTFNTESAESQRHGRARYWLQSPNKKVYSLLGRSNIFIHQTLGAPGRKF